jgi:hypothetical protein
VSGVLIQIETISEVSYGFPEISLAFLYGIIAG